MRTLTNEELSTIAGNGAASAPPYGGYDDGPAAPKGGCKADKKS